MEKDIIVTCPYNSSHRIRRYKLISHIIKCKKYNDKGDKTTCPLDNSHIIDHNRMTEHIASCSNLVSLIQSNVEEEKYVVPTIDDIDTHKSIENWDELPEVPSYDPMENSAKKKVIRCVTGLSKSERKKFRKDEQHRLTELGGICPTKSAPSSSKDMEHEIPLRPPRGSAQVFLRDTETKQYDPSKTTTTYEFRDRFHKTLYNELLSDCEPDINQEEHISNADNNQYEKFEDYRKTESILMEKSLELSPSNNMSLDKSLYSLGACAKDYSHNTNRKERNLPILDKKQEIDIKDQVNNSKKKSKYIENTFNANTSEEQVTEKLLALLKDDTNIKKVESLEEMKKDDEDRNLDLEWKEILKKLNILTDIQNVAAEQSALLAKKLSELKLSNTHMQSPVDNDILHNPRCAANFTEHVSSQYKAQLESRIISQKKQTFMKSTPSSNEYNANNDNNTLDMKDNKNSELHKLKTPSDFYRHCHTSLNDSIDTYHEPSTMNDNFKNFKVD